MRVRRGCEVAVQVAAAESERHCGGSAARGADPQRCQVVLGRSEPAPAASMQAFVLPQVLQGLALVEDA